MSLWQTWFIKVCGGLCLSRNSSSISFRNSSRWYAKFALISASKPFTGRVHSTWRTHFLHTKCHNDLLRLCWDELRICWQLMYIESYVRTLIILKNVMLLTQLVFILFSQIDSIYWRAWQRHMFSARNSVLAREQLNYFIISILRK